MVDVIDGDECWEIIDEIARKYTGQPYPLREDRVAFSSNLSTFGLRASADPRAR